MNNILKSLRKIATMDVCTYKLLKNEFAKSVKPPPIKLYNILKLKMVQIN